MMKILLVFALFLYVIEISVKDITLSDVRRISLIQSYSPFESYIFADFSLITFCFFAYFKSENQKKEYVWYYVSFLFVLFTFKRVLVLFAIVIFILEKSNVFYKKIPKYIISIMAILFFIGTMIYTQLLDKQTTLLLKEIVGIDLDKFTVGRQWYFSLIHNPVFISAGYGSSTTKLIDILGPAKYLEMDLVKINIEVGVVGLGIFIWSYWKQIFNNVFSICVMFFIFMNMFFSHSLTTFQVWTLTLIMLYTVRNSEEKRNMECSCD